MTATTIRSLVLNCNVLVSSRSVKRAICNLLAFTGILYAGAFWGSPAAQALDVNVSNYSWLQLPSTSVTTFVGSANNNIGTAFGNTIDPRWGDYVWLPTNTMTNTGADMYYAGVRLDQPRQIDSVRLQWWTAGGNTATQYHIDGSNDGTSWTNMTTQAVGFGAVNGTVTNVAVTPATYQYVRVRLEGPDYQAGGGYGGPGFLLIDPIGSGTVSSDKVNWANAPTFSTTINNTGFTTYNSTTYNDGTLEDRAGTTFWAGTSGNWGAGEYTTIDLQDNRLVSSVSAIWANPYGGNDYDLEYSVDGTNFFSVSNPTGPINYSPEHFVGATEIRFDPTIARYVRMLNASGAFSGFTLMNQMLIHSPTEGVLDSNYAPNSTISMTAPTGSSSGTLIDGIQLENNGAPGSAIGILSYSITGLDAAEFDLSNFAPTVLMDGEDVFFDIDFNAPALGTYNALLSFNTSVGILSFNLESSPAPAPEPTTALMLGLGIILPLMGRRRKQLKNQLK